MIKKQEIMLSNYRHMLKYGYTDLYQVYGCFSAAKQKALDYCKGLQRRLGGHDGIIVSWNTFQFTYAFQYTDNDTGHECLCYCTKCNDYKFAIEAV